MDIRAVIDQIIMLFLLMGCGLMLRKRKVMTDGVLKGVNELIMTVTWPLLMISITQKPYTPESLAVFAWIFFGTIVLLGAGMIVTYIVFKRLKLDMTPVMSMICIMPNAGFFGIPIVQALYGDAGLLYLSAYIVGFNVVLWTVPITMYSGFSVKALRNLVNPGIVCAVIGIALFLLRITLPGPVIGTVNHLANMNTPLSMLILGARMDTLRPAHFLDGKLWLCVIIKLIVLPLIAVLMFRPLGLTGMTLMIIVASSAMPTAASTQLLAERYGGDVQFTAKSLSVSTLCSMVSMPAILAIAELFAH